MTRDWISKELEKFWEDLIQVEIYNEICIIKLVTVILSYNQNSSTKTQCTVPPNEKIPDPDCIK